MIEYLNGTLVEASPAHIVLDVNMIGYFINISLPTYEDICSKKNCLVYTHQIIREDEHLLFGFSSKEERQLFRNLISVSGVGPNTARVILSSVQSAELTNAIVYGNVKLLQSIKGIGAKTAQRIIIDLKDKLNKDNNLSAFSLVADNNVLDEASAALVMLGFQKKPVEQILQKLLNEGIEKNVESLVKNALSRL